MAGALDGLVVVDLTRQRLLGWLKGMFGGDKPPSDER